MALLPIMLSDVLEELDHPFRNELTLPHFYEGDMRPYHALILKRPNLRKNFKPRKTLRHISKHNDFKLNFDVQQFKPEELSVKLENNTLVIEGKHEEREDQHGYIMRQFTRRCKIPKDIDVTKLESNLSSDGVLTLTAPKKITASSKHIEIPIIQTDEPAITNATEGIKKLQHGEANGTMEH